MAPLSASTTLTLEEFVSRIEEANTVARWFIFHKSKVWRRRARAAGLAISGNGSDIVQEVLARMLERLRRKPIRASLTTAVCNFCRWTICAMLSGCAWKPSGDLPDVPDGSFSVVVSDLRPTVMRVLDSLTYREREIFKLRYGLGDGNTYTLEQCGRIFKVTRERIRSIESRALRKLQHVTRADRLRGLLDHDEIIQYSVATCSGYESFTARSDDQALSIAWGSYPGWIEVRCDGQLIWKRSSYDSALRIPQHPR